MKFAAHLWDRGNLVEMLVENSFDGVDFVETSWRYFLAGDEAGLEHMGGMMEERGLSISTVHAPFGPEDDLSNPDEAARKATLERHGTLMDRVALLGVDRIVIHPSPPVEERDAAARESCLLDSLGILVKEAEKRDMRLALENMPPGHLGADGRSLRRIVEKASGPRLGVCFDTGHAHITEEGVGNAFEALKDLTIAFHIHDNDSTRDMHIPPPYGTIDWIGFAKQLDTIEIDDPMTIEARPWAGRDRGAMIEEVKAVLAGRHTYVCPACGHMASVPAPESESRGQSRMSLTSS